MTFDIITIFPDIFDSYFSTSIIKRAREQKKIKINIHDLRKYGTDKRQSVDDRPYGGGAGMLLMAQPIIKNIADITTKLKHKKIKVILFSAKGKPWNQAKAKKYAKFDNVIMICGRYEGVDERVKKFVDEEISIGDYVLTGGEIPAMILVDSIARLIPGVLGNNESAKFESHAKPGLLEYPQYTRPETLDIKDKKLKVPKILLSGDHKQIEKWRINKQKYNK